MRSLIQSFGLFAVICNFASYGRADEAAPAPFIDPFAHLSLARGDDSDRIARARGLRASGIALVAVGTATTVASQVLLALAVTSSDPFGLGNPHVPGEPLYPGVSHSYLIGAITTVVVGNAMLATGLALWSTGDTHGGRPHGKAGSVGTLGFASDGHGAQGGLVVHF